MSCNLDTGTVFIVKTNALSKHDGMTRGVCHFPSGVTTDGEPIFNSFAAVMPGVNIIHLNSIGEDSVVGAGSLVLHDVPEQAVEYGVPARVIRSREPREPYLSASPRILRILEVPENG